MNCAEIETRTFQSVKEKIVFLKRRVPLPFQKNADRTLGHTLD